MTLGIDYKKTIEENIRERQKLKLLAKNIGGNGEGVAEIIGLIETAEKNITFNMCEKQCGKYISNIVAVDM